LNWLVAALAVWAAGAALIVLMRAAYGARRRKQRARTRLRQLSQLRSPSGRPFFPHTAEDKRREARVLHGWDPDWDD
jgi:hypothetical protein